MADEPSSAELFRSIVDAPAEEPKAPAPEPSPPPTETAPPEEPTPAPAAEPPKEAPGEAQIPSWRLREEADARRAAEDRARQLQEHLNRTEAGLRQRQAQEAPKPDFCEEPEKAVEAITMRTLAPVAEYLQRVQKRLMALDKLDARESYGAERVSAAEQAFFNAMNDRSLTEEEYERVVQAPNRYEEVVKWHTNRVIGHDPEAYFRQRFEAELANPETQARILERIRGAAGTRPGNVQLPPSLSKAGNAAPPIEGAADMSDAAQFAFAKR